MERERERERERETYADPVLSRVVGQDVERRVAQRVVVESVARVGVVVPPRRVGLGIALAGPVAHLLHREARRPRGRRLGLGLSGGEAEQHRHEDARNENGAAVDHCVVRGGGWRGR